MRFVRIFAGLTAELATNRSGAVKIIVTFLLSVASCVRYLEVCPFVLYFIIKVTNKDR